jgi:hypothetical protein
MQASPRSTGNRQLTGSDLKTVAQHINTCSNAGRNLNLGRLPKLWADEVRVGRHRDVNGGPQLGADLDGAGRT